MWGSTARTGRLTETEDLLSEAHSTLEDLVETAAAFREIRSSVREVHQESCALVEQSQRERRLRTTKLRLVKDPRVVAGSEDF